MPLPYRKVSDLYKTLKDAGVVTTDLPSWSEEMNRLSQSDLYSAGLQDNFVKQASVGLDRLLEKTGLPQVSGDVGAAVGGLIGAPDVGRQIGESTPRLGVGMLGFLGGPVAGAATLGALTGTEAYTATGSPAAGVVSGAVNAAMPGAMNVLEKAAFTKLGGRLLSGPLADAAGNVTGAVTGVPLGTAGQKFGAFAAGQIGGAAFGEAGTALGAAVDPNAEYQFDPKAALLGATLGQAPFTALHLANKVVGRSKETMTPQQLDAYLQSSAKNIELKAARDKAAEKSPLETHPLAEPLPPGKVDLRTQAETDAVLDRIRGRKTELKAEPTEDSVRELDKLDAEELELIAERARGGATDDTLFGRSLPRQEELAPLADPASDPLVFGKELSDIAAKMQPDMGFDDFRAVVEEMNAVRAKHKAPLMTDDTIKRYATKWNIKDPQEAVRGIVNAEVLGTEAATQQSVTQAHVDAFAEALKDPEVMALATELEGKGRPGSFQKAVVQWINDGKPGGAEGLKSRALKAKKKGGTGAPVVAKTEVAAKANVPETAHVTRVRGKAAARATEIVTPDLQGEAQEFRAAFADGSITGKEYQELLQSEHWQEWLSDANEELKMMGEHGNTPMAVPNVPAGGGFTWDFVPYDEGTNKLGKHTLPDGRKAFHVIEVQSDWGQAMRKSRETLERHGRNEIGIEPESARLLREKTDKGDHPLLSVYEPLALKAAIDHARSVGAEAIILSDGETAMMTEGHDKNPQDVFGATRENQEVAKGDVAYFKDRPDRVNNIPEGQEYVNAVTAIANGESFQTNSARVAARLIDNGYAVTGKAVSQSAGMRLHYDTTLPSAMKKLTGRGGERVEVGVHKQAIAPNNMQALFNGEAQQPQVGSPVFRNPDGTPKSSITGRLYPLDKVAAKFDAQGGPTLTDPSRAPGAGGTDAIPWTPVTPDEQARYAALSPDSGGLGLLRELQRSADGATRALADSIAKQFPESLKRIAVRIMQMSREGYAQQRGNREVDVVLSHATLMNPDIVRREQVMMHELLHGLSVAEIDNPIKAPLVQELDALRERLIAGLPREIRLRIKFAIDDGWYSAYATGKPFKGRRAEMSDLGPKEYQQIAYGLLNTKELLTQGFTSKQMQRHMQLLKGPQKKGFGVFVDYVKRLLGFGGEVSDSEFAHFLDASSRLLKQGEYVSDLSNFTDQWFAQKGLSPARVREQSRRALEVVQSTNDIADKELMLTTLAQHQPQSQEFVNAKKMLDKMWADGGEHADSATAVLSELNIPTGEIDGALVLHIAQHEPLFHEAMDVLPEPVTSYLFARARDMKSVLESVDAAVSEKNDGLINIANPAELRSPVRETVKALDRFLKLEDKRQIERGMLMRMSVAPDAFFDQVQNGLSAAPEAFNAIDEGVPMSKIGEWITPPAQIARSNPLFAEWYSRALLMPAKIREQVLASMRFISRDIKADGTLGPENDKATLERRFKMLESPTLQKGIDRLLWKKQELGKDSNKVVQLPYDGAEFKEITKGMKPEDVKNLIEFDNIIRLSKHAADMQTLDALRQDLSMRAARLPMKDEGMKLNVANDAATQLFDALNEDFNDPASAAKANAKIQAVQSRMQPQSFLNLLKFTENSVAYHKELSLHLLNNPDWVTASRMKDFKFEYFKGNKRVLASANTMKEAKQMAGGAEILNWKRNERSDDDPVFAGNNSVEFIEKLRQYEENQMEALKNYGASDDVKAAMERLSVVAQVERDLNFQGANLGNLIPPGRTLGKGADQLPWFENHVDWITKNAGYWQRRLLRTTAESMRLEPGTAGTDTADLIGKHAEEMFQRDPEIGRAVQKVAATWSLGFNLATQIANSTQTWMRGVTELIALGHGPVAALREMKGAWKDLIGKRIGQDKLTDPVENKFLADALHEGMLDATITDENAQANELSSVNLKRTLNAEKPKTLGQHLGSAAGAYSNASMAIFRMGEYANNKAQLLATFRSLQKLRPELSYVELKKQAYLVNASVNDVGGRANRPLGPYSGKGDFSRTAAMAATSMQSYVLGSTMQLVRNLKKGLLRGSGLTPAEVYAARKAAVYQLAVQFAAAGTLGMPFVSGALALLNQAFPELELNKNLRMGVSSLFGSDGENGHILSDIAMSGVPSMLGWDFSSRLNAGNLLPGVSEYNGFQPEQLLGVPASMVGNFIKGGKKLAAGDLSGGYAFVPPAVKKLTELAMEGGQARDYRGRPLMTPTPGESIGLALGFQPTRLKDYNTADRMAQQSEHLQIVRKGQETQKLAEEVMKGNFGTVRSQIQQQIAADKNYNPADAVRAIARTAEEMTFPKDLRREGSRRDMDSRSKLLSSFNLDPVNVSEVARLQFRRQLEQRLGLMSDDSTALRKAQLMDQLRLQNPTATRASLSAAATSALRRTSASSLGLQ